MNIIKKIKAGVLASTGLPLHYGDKNELNIELDTATFPSAYGITIDGSTIETDGARFRERVAMVVAFVTLQSSEASIDVEDTIEQMKQKAFQWLAWLRRSDDFDVVVIGQAGRIYREFDGILCGYSVQVTVRERVGTCLIYETDDENI